MNPLILPLARPFSSPHLAPPPLQASIPYWPLGEEGGAAVSFKAPYSRDRLGRSANVRLLFKNVLEK